MNISLQDEKMVLSWANNYVRSKRGNNTFDDYIRCLTSEPDKQHATLLGCAALVLLESHKEKYDSVDSCVYSTIKRNIIRHM